MPWEAIKYVSSGVTLLAFIAAIVLEIYRRTLLSREQLIKLAPGAERARLVKSTLREFFDVDTNTLSEDHAYQLALEQIRARSRRYFINAVVVFAIFAVSAAVATASFINRPPHPDISDTPIKESSFTAEQVKLSRLPPEMLEGLGQQTTQQEKIRSLKAKGSLHLDNACLVLGDLADPPRTVALSLYTLTLTRSSCIITNGNSLNLTVFDLSGAGGTIQSFDAQTQKPPDAPAGIRGTDGRNAGTVTLRVLDHVVGPLMVTLRGQDGGRGGPGGGGGQGPAGNRGADAVKGLFDCRSGGQDGSPGGKGLTGGAGMPGGNGGAGGALILRAAAARDHAQIVSEPAQPDGGAAGKGGPGGDGGPGGPGGQGGSGDGFCSGGHAAPNGLPGDRGPSGADGSPGAKGSQLDLKPDDGN